MITFRLAEISDARDLFEWRNDPQTRSASVATNAVNWEDHIAWLTTSISSQDRTLLIVEEAGASVGTVRIDGNELSWTIAPSHRGRGIGKAVVHQVAKSGMTARIRRDNLGSQIIAKSAGFELAEDGDIQLWHFPREQNRSSTGSLA